MEEPSLIAISFLKSIHNLQQKMLNFINSSIEPSLMSLKFSLIGYDNMLIGQE